MTLHIEALTLSCLRPGLGVVVLCHPQGEHETLAEPE
jgi:hypothetical protein